MSINPATTRTKSNGLAKDNPFAAPRTLEMPEEIEAPSGCLVRAPVSIDNAAALAGLDLIVSFPRYALECVGVEIGADAARFTLESQEREGYVRVSMADAVALDEGAAELVALVFRVVGDETTDSNPAPVVRVNYAELKGELGESFRWFTTVEREDCTIVVLKPGPCPESKKRDGDHEADGGGPLAGASYGAPGAAVDDGGSPVVEERAAVSDRRALENVDDDDALRGNEHGPEGEKDLDGASPRVTARCGCLTDQGMDGMRVRLAEWLLVGVSLLLLLMLARNRP